MRLVVLVMLCLSPYVANAQLRPIPSEAKAGEIRHLHDSVVTIDGVALRLAPGAQIRDEWNRIVLPAALPAGAQVKYLLNDQGLVRQVWILSPAEAAKLEAVKN